MTHRMPPSGSAPPPNRNVSRLTAPTAAGSATATPSGAGGLTGTASSGSVTPPTDMSPPGSVGTPTGHPPRLVAMTPAGPASTTCSGVGEKTIRSAGDRRRGGPLIPALGGSDAEWTSIGISGDHTCGTHLDHKRSGVGVTTATASSDSATEPTGTGCPTKVGSATTWLGAGGGYAHICGTRLGPHPVRIGDTTVSAGSVLATPPTAGYPRRSRTTLIPEGSTRMRLPCVGAGQRLLTGYSRTCHGGVGMG